VARWEQVVTAFVRLFKTTTPHQLFDESLRVERDNSHPDVAETNGTSVFLSGLVEFRARRIPEIHNGPLIPSPLSLGSEILQSDSLPNGSNSTLDRRRVFKQIIVKCVLQLLLIETTHELLQNQEVYRTIPPEQLLRLMAELDHSYQFARSFNGDRELRTGLWRVGMSNCKFKCNAAAPLFIHVV
jgi:brefeldin A-inhibited guanine nucleotide-exchange protein